MPGVADELRRRCSTSSSIDVDLFRGRQPDTERQRVFGGQVAAQALVAAARTVERGVRRALAALLLPAPRRHRRVPIVYDVENIRDGRSFATRRVSRRQHGRPIYYRRSTSRCPRTGLEHQDPMPDVMPPEEGCRPGRAARGSAAADAEHWEQEWAAARRPLRRQLRGRRPGRRPRPPGAGAAVDPGRRQPLPDDPLVHLAAFTYASDMTLLGAALVPHGIDIALAAAAAGLARPHDLVPPAVPRRRVVALRPVLAVGRGRPRPGLARVFTQDGELVATVAQEGLIRVRDDRADVTLRP